MAATPAKRKEKFDAIKKEEYLNLLRNGGRRHVSARTVGIDPTTVLDHMNKYPEFADSVSRAEMEANEMVEDALYQAAVAGHVTACQVWLYNRIPQNWADKRNIKVQGDANNPVQVHTTVDPAELEAKVQAVLKQRNDRG
jgi:hypothetical protein